MWSICSAIQRMCDGEGGCVHQTRSECWHDRKPRITEIQWPMIKIGNVCRSTFCNNWTILHLCQGSIAMRNVFLPFCTYCCQNQWATNITYPTGRNVSPNLIIRSFSKLSSHNIFMWWIIWPFINFCWTYFGYTQKLRVVPSEIDRVWITALRQRKKTNILVSWIFLAGRRIILKFHFSYFVKWLTSDSANI